MRDNDWEGFHGASRGFERRARWKPLKEALEQFAVCVHPDAQSDVLTDQIAQIVNDDGEDRV